MAVAIPDEVLAVLKESKVEADRITLPPTQLERSLYVATNKVLEALGGKWNRKEKAHLFTVDPRPAIQSALSQGKYADQKKEFQFFETPAALADRMVELARIRPGYMVLEPSAGNGRIADAIPKSARLVCVELNPECAKTLRGKGYFVVNADFLTWEPRDAYYASYDRILMNPPFTKGQDVDHIRRAFSLLKPGGILVAISMPSWQTNGQKKFVEFRAWLGKQDATVEELPEGTFKESGTDIKTLLLVIKREAK
jgi:predicted RNA methylase